MRRAEPSDASVPLTRLRTRAHAVVASLDRATDHDRSKLMALGLIPGAELLLLQRFPSYVVQVGYTQLALDRETASVIDVRPP